MNTTTANLMTATADAIKNAMTAGYTFDQAYNLIITRMISERPDMARRLANGLALAAA